MGLNKFRKIVLISSGQPSLNPRLVKEADTLAAAGYDVTVLYSYWNEWGTVLDNDILPERKWRAICAGGDPIHRPVIFFLSRLFHKLSAFAFNKTGLKYFAAFAIARSSCFLIHEARKHNADLYIGHNLGALPATVKAAKTNKKPCGFDAEDFHRYEVSDDEKNVDVILKTHIEDKYITQVNYLTTSSPGIAAAYRQLYNDKGPVTLLNVFPADDRVKAPKLNDGVKLKLFWFSQTVGYGRGLGDCIKALLILENPYIELHLLGFAPEPVRKKINYIAANKIKVIFHRPVSPDDVVLLASQFDIGLAPETSIPFNRDICLTNKLFTYIQAGLAIVSSDTTAQKELLEKYDGIGRIYKKGNAEMLASVIQSYFDNRNDLYKANKASWDIARSALNWEKESEKFLHVVKETLAV